MNHRTPQQPFPCHNPATLLLVLATAAAGARAQDDLRDVVHLKDGREVRGRVLTPHHPTTLTVAIGGRSEKVDRRTVDSTATVQRHLAELLQRRRQHIDNPKLRLFLAEWARSRDLDEMARLLALELVLEDPDHESAHEFLGHQPSPEGWLWHHDDRWLTRAQLERSILDWQDAMELDSEHWRLKFNAGLPEAVKALIDLEHLYLFWHDTFGVELQLQEALTGNTKLEIRARRSPDGFPRWGQRQLPHYTPNPFGDVGDTFYSAAQPARPDALFFLGTQHILYHCLMDNPRMRTARDRVCAWLEVGLGRYAEQVMQGAPGLAHGEPPALLDPVDARNSLAWPGTIENLIHMPMYASFYMRDEYITDTNWGAASSFCSYLLEHPDPEVKKRFRTYIRKALQDRAGDSSSAFDGAMGRDIKSFEAPWRAFAAKVLQIGG